MDISFSKIRDFISKVGVKKKIVLLCVVMFHLGYEASSNDLFPLTHYFERQFGTPDEEPVLTLTQLKYSIYSDTSAKQRIACPQPDNVFVVASFGQSNAANAAGHRFTNSKKSIINFFNGACYVATDPILGAAGIQGSIWLPFLQKLEVNKPILLINFAIGSSSIAHWLSADNLEPLLDENMHALKQAGFHTDLVLWIQGEADARTAPQKYEQQLQALISNIKTLSPKSKIGISSTTYCMQGRSTEIAKSQRHAAQTLDLIWLGNTDDFTANEDRYDDCHFSYLGVEKVTTMFADKVNQSLFN